MEKPLKNAIKKLVPEPSNLASRSFTRLHKAVLGITTEPLGTILRASRASINDADSSGRSVLHWAAHMGDGEMLNAILRCGAEPNLPCIAGRTPMHYAAKCGSEECVVSLIAAGANLDPKDSEGETPLHLASDRARNRVVELLLKAGADITLGNKYGEIPLAYAATENNREGVSIFLQYGADIDATDDRGYTPLLDAIWANAHDVIEFLLEKGAHYNVKTKDSMTVLHFAARYGDIRTIELLEERRMLGVHPTAINTEGYTALSLLSQRADMSGELAETFGALLFSINPDPRDDMSNFGLVVEDNSRTAEQEFTDAVEYLHDSEAFLGGLNGRQGEEQDALRRVESDGNEDVFADTVEFL
jgi:ankyrin repeat protein